MSRRPSAVRVINGRERHHVPELPRSGVPAAADKLTLAELCDELQISRSTFYDWRAKGRGPRCIKLPNGDIRVRRLDLEQWLNTLEEVDP